MSKEFPLILSLDTSLEICTIAISSGNTLIAENSINIKKLHDKLLAQMAKQSLSNLGLGIADLDAVAISSGPGSFTGLRIGAAFAIGLTIDNTPKLISLPTLLLFSVQSEEIAKLLNCTQIETILTANSGMAYHQLFNLNSNVISQPIFEKIQEIQPKEKSFIAGNYKISDRPFLNTNNFIHPWVLAETSYRFYQNNQFIQSNEFEPIYLQEFIPK